MANTHTPLLQEFSRVADSYAINDQLSVLFRREVAEDSQKLQEFRMLSSELREAIRMRDQYIDELKMLTVESAYNVVGLSLAFTDRHGITELYGKLSSFKYERKVGIFMNE
ncbi:hypothetical protein Tco_1136146 [Tanacetum coccineum]